MPLRKTLLSLAVAVLVAVPLTAGADQAGMAHKDGIMVSDAWIRAALANRPTAGYMMVKNTGDTADRLVTVRSGAFETIELHESRMTDGVMSMRPVPAIDVPAGGMATLKPGGMHLMLFGGKGLEAGGQATLTLVFETAGEITLTVPVTKGGHSGHGAGHGDHGKVKE